MPRINPEKLLLSKWTARTPANREKHFLVIALYRDDDENVQEIELEAVLTKTCRRLPWQALKDEARWQIGWK
ncbi:TIGR02450 family Trp-rich protein [Marinobacterium rhizophilum]|uniref:TIGR02450 family Trp-rich protein n=1 Tax=Marinobacterium rhizophilum TaxID=420402 RepID=A0ABY5HIY6_9GAMM|nr:TIGR02450 family Trp-rich protein [Marinobacterium rhizophilum]UTW12069.1 TIGR02450 family Trp-rich protein [Marinobacterium rhizophilum]